MNTFKSLFRRYGLEVAVVTIGIVLAAGSGEPGGAAMIAALAYVVASAFLELRRHRWLGINAALVAAALVLTTGPAAVLVTGGDAAYWTAPLIALAMLVMGYVAWLVAGMPRARRLRAIQSSENTSTNADTSSFNNDWSLHPGFARLRGNVWNRHYRFVHDDE